MLSYHTKDSVKNPLPSKMKVWDYYENSRGWQRRYIVWFDEKNCGYATYFEESWEWVKSDNFNTLNYCSKGHIRSWSQK